MPAHDSADDTTRKAFVRAVRTGDTDTVARMLDSGEVPLNEPLFKNGDVPHGTPMYFACVFGTPAMVRLLIERGVDVDTPDHLDITPLTQTLLSSHARLLSGRGTCDEVVRILLDAGADPNGKGDGVTPLIAATMAGDLDLVRLLVERGARVTGGPMGGVGMTLRMAEERGHPEIVAYLRSISGLDLHEAADRGDAEAVRALLEGSTPPDIRDDRSRTPLHKAARAGRIDILSLLLDRGADPNAADDSGYTPLMEAASGGSAVAAHLLLERGADLHAENEAGQTALTRAALGKESRAEVISLLLERGARCGLTEATLAGRTELVRHLLSQGTPPDTADSGGMTALMAAATNGRIELAEMLLEAGAEINAVDQRGYTPLLWAVARQELGTTRLLLERGAEINRHTALEDTALHQAVTGAMVPSNTVWRELISLLLAHGAEVDARAGMECTPLLNAAKYGVPAEVARMLLDAGADIEARDQFGYTPLMRAMEESVQGVNLELVRLLLERGANPRATGERHFQSVLSCARQGKSEAALRLLMETLGPEYALIHATGQGDTARMKELLVAGVPPDAGVDVQRYLSRKPNSEASAKEEKWDYEMAREHPLIVAACQGKAEAVRLLLEHGAGTGPAKDIALTLTQFRAEGREEIRRLLREAGAVERKLRGDD